MVSGPVCHATSALSAFGCYPLSRLLHHPSCGNFAEQGHRAAGLGSHDAFEWAEDESGHRGLQSRNTGDCDAILWQAPTSTVMVELTVVRVATLLRLAMVASRAPAEAVTGAAEQNRLGQSLNEQADHAHCVQLVAMTMVLIAAMAVSFGTQGKHPLLSLR
jgi:hypothetical protein